MKQKLIRWVAVTSMSRMCLWQFIFVTWLNLLRSSFVSLFTANKKCANHSKASHAVCDMFNDSSQLVCVYFSSHTQDRSSWQEDEPRCVLGLHLVSMVIWVLKLLLLPIDGCWYLVSEPMYLCKCHLRHFLLISPWTCSGSQQRINVIFKVPRKFVMINQHFDIYFFNFWTTHCTFLGTPVQLLVMK